jgi:hypothetical protein|tara:strand:- start:579 stop:1061 length:483 start_codon:yes stop_codon:yes gene_type:complete
MKKILTKLNFIPGIFVVMIAYFPGLLIGELATIILKVVLKVFNSIISFMESVSPIPVPYVRGTVDVIFEAFAMTALGRAAGIYIMIFVPMLIFKKFIKMNINWFPAIFLLIPTLLWLGGIRQIQRYAELYDGIYFASISLGFMLGTFTPLYLAYLYAKDE